MLFLITLFRSHQESYKYQSLYIYLHYIINIYNICEFTHCNMKAALLNSIIVKRLVLQYSDCFGKKTFII